MASPEIDRSTKEWELLLGERIKRIRIDERIEQEDLAQKAGLSVGAVKNLENGKGSSLKSFIKVIRALGREEWLEAFAPAASISPIQKLKSSRPPQKVYPPRSSRQSTSE